MFPIYISNLTSLRKAVKVMSLPPDKTKKKKTTTTTVAVATTTSTFLSPPQQQHSFSPQASKCGI